jgi:hypothetical protein
MTINVPFKTPLGQDELKSRTLKLGQRHRTILFLIDGRRPLAEVLSLAQQAGAQTQHFEDLLRLGLVELPPDPTPPPAPAAAPPDAALTSVELVVLEDEVVTTPAPLVTEIEEPAEPEAHVGDVDHEDFARLDLDQDDACEAGDTVANPRAADPDNAEEQALPLPPQPMALPVLKEELQAPPPSDDRGDIALPLPDQAEARLLQQVRDLLTNTLSLDAPLFSARIFMRVRAAQSMGELIDLVWEIQDHLNHKRSSRRDLQSLQRARELLGLGNTLVSDDSRPDYLDK